MGKTTAQKDAPAVKDGIRPAVGDTTKAYFKTYSPAVSGYSLGPARPYEGLLARAHRMALCRAEVPTALARVSEGGVSWLEGNTKNPTQTTIDKINGPTNRMIFFRPADFVQQLNLEALTLVD